MLAAELKSQIDKLRDRFWSGGISNPLTAIEQISYLIFMKRLEDMEHQHRRTAERTGSKHVSIFKGHEDCRWSQWLHMAAEAMLVHVRDQVFPFIKNLTGEDSYFARAMKDAVFMIPKPSLLQEAVRIVDELNIAQQNQDTQGDLYEYLLSKLNTSGENGQFRTPRHIIRMMVKLIDPKIGERICDPAAGTGGFLLNAYQHILESNSYPDTLEYDDDGTPKQLPAEKLTAKQRTFLKTNAFTAYDFDTTMVRIGLMNLVLHGISQPRFFYADTLSKAFEESSQYQVILAIPPFKGSIDKSDISDQLRIESTKTELLFVDLMLRLLVLGGRCAVIVPDGVLFGSSNAHQALRKILVEENQLDGIVSLPSGVFKPYAGVSAAVLLFTKGGQTDKVWFYDMQADGFSLDDKRQPISDNDIPDIIKQWTTRAAKNGPKKGDQWFWVDKVEIAENKYDLSLSRYKPVVYEEVEYEKPNVILKNILVLEDEIKAGLLAMSSLVK